MYFQFDDVTLNWWNLLVQSTKTKMSMTKKSYEEGKIKLIGKKSAKKEANQQSYYC
jgi:hypothetical protein